MFTNTNNNNNMGFSSERKGVSAISLTIVETGSYNDQWSRPFQTEISPLVMGSIDEMMASHQRMKTSNQRFSPSNFGAIANNFMAPAAQPVGTAPVAINQGWKERRARFVLVLEETMPTGDKVVKVILGYTSHLGMTTQNIDPNLEFHINSTFSLRSISYQDPQYGLVTSYTPVEAASILHNPDWKGIQHLNQNQLFTMRPEDVYSAIDTEGVDFGDDLIDTRLTLGSEAAKSRRSNSLSTDFMARMLDSHSEAVTTQRAYGMDTAQISSTAQGFVSEKMAFRDMFLGMIGQIRGINHASNYFTYKELLRIDPSLQNSPRVQVNFLKDAEKSRTAYSEYTAPWHAATRETQVAVILGQAVPALMMECGVSFLRFSCDNLGFHRQTTFVPTVAAGFVPGTAMETFVEMFRVRFLNEIMKTISDDHTTDIQLEIKSDVQGDTEIKLIHGSQPGVVYVAPSFCDSLWSPILTDDRNNVNNMARHFKTLMDHIVPLHQDTGFNGFAGGGSTLF